MRGRLKHHAVLCPPASHRTTLLSFEVIAAGVFRGDLLFMAGSPTHLEDICGLGAKMARNVVGDPPGSSPGLLRVIDARAEAGQSCRAFLRVISSARGTSSSS